MAFAIFYNRQDLTPIVAEAQRTNLSQADRRLAQAVWGGGLSGWDTAPLAPLAQRCVDTPQGQRCDDDMRIVVINATVQGQVVTLAQFRDFLNRQSVLPGGEYLAALADDMSRSSGALEPWPQV